MRNLFFVFLLAICYWEPCVSQKTKTVSTPIEKMKVVKYIRLKNMKDTIYKIDEYNRILYKGIRTKDRKWIFFLKGDTIEIGTFRRHYNLGNLFWNTFLTSDTIMLMKYKIWEYYDDSTITRVNYGKRFFYFGVPRYEKIDRRR